MSSWFCLGGKCGPKLNDLLTYVTRSVLALADAGVHVMKIKELMGQASIVTTMRYIHATDEGKRRAITGDRGGARYPTS